MSWIRKNWQFITAIGLIAGWSVTNWTNYQVLVAENAHEFSDAAEHRERLETRTAKTEKRVNKMAKDVTKTREKMIQIDIRQQEQTKTLNSIDRSVNLLLERSIRKP